MKNKVIGAVRHALKQDGIKNFGKDFKSGYHTMEIEGEVIQGQRDLDKRFEYIDYDFKGKTVLDLGCNTGGMLFKIGHEIKQGVGVDFNTRLINVANLLRYVNHDDELSFYVFDLVKEPLDQLSNFMRDPIDVCFMLSISYNVSTWKEVVAWCRKNTKTLIYEAHGTDDFIKEQVQILESHYSTVKRLSAVCTDDNDGPKSRQLFICEK